MHRFLSLLALFALTGCPGPGPTLELRDTPGDAPIVDGGASDSPAPDDDAGMDAGTPPELGYLEDIHPVFEAAGCSTFACHGSTPAGAGAIVYMPTARIAYDDMIDRPSVLVDGAVVVSPGAPDASRLVLHAEDTHVPMGILTAEQAMLVRRWVEDGAAYSRTGSTDLGFVADVPGSGCDLGGARHWPELPAACLPRCTMATWDGIVACRDDADVAACQAAVIGADDTAPTTLSGGTDVVQVDCSQCLEWQTRSCIDASCPLELTNFDRCTIAGTCTTEAAALQTCRTAHPEIVTCQRTRDRLCAPSP